MFYSFLLSIVRIISGALGSKGPVSVAIRRLRNSLVVVREACVLPLLVSIGDEVSVSP